MIVDGYLVNQTPTQSHDSQNKASGKVGFTRRERRRGSCRTHAKLGRSLALPFESQAGRFPSAARLIPQTPPSQTLQ